MGQHKIKLSNVRVASPCSQKWEEMVGDDRLRFCSHCQLNVYNFSVMTKAEVESFLMKAEGRICGRFYQRADGTMLTQREFDVRTPKRWRLASVPVLLLANPAKASSPGRCKQSAPPAG